MLANAPLVSSLGLLLSSAIAVQAVGAMGGVQHWLQASEARLVAHAATAPVPPSEPESTGVPHRVKRAADGMFYLAGNANRAPIRFLIDTGSSTTILTRSDARRLGLDASDQGSHSARTLAGEVRITQARVKDLRLAGRRFADVEVGVASDDLGVSLVGQDVLSRFDSIVIERDRASLR